MDQSQKELIGQRIKERREFLKLSQKELAEKAKKSSAAYIAFIEGGNRSISTLDLMLLAKALGVTVSYLVGESTEVEKGDPIQALRADDSLNKTDRQKVEEYYKLLKDKNKNNE